MSGPQFSKRKEVVLKGGRTQRHQPAAPAGFAAQSTIGWTLTLKPR